jgi:hypothetical protein
MNRFTQKGLFPGFLLLAVSLFLPAQQTDSDMVNQAIGAGDCAALYNYTQKEGADRKLVSSATTALRRYVSADPGVLKYRTNRMDPRIRRVSEELMEKVFADPAANLEAVTAALVSGLSDRLARAKVIHDWICDNVAYDAEMYFDGWIKDQDYVSVLKKKAGVCSGYASVFNEMCRLAGVESIGVSGYSKGFGYRGYIGSGTDHEWNAVKSGGKWYLVDVTWDAGHLDRRTFIKNYSTAYLFLDSRSFLYSHLPAAEKYQFYAPPITPEIFMREAYVPGKFFQYGLSLKSDGPLYNNVLQEYFAFDLGARGEVDISSELRTPGQRDVEGAAWINRLGSSYTFYYDVPDTADYQGHVFARFRNERRLQERVDIAEFEQRWLPGARGLLEAERITEKELEYFENSYFKVPDNNSYHFIEDQFDTQRNNTVSKIHNLLGLRSGWMESVLYFNMKAAPEYPGYGTLAKKHPNTYALFNEAYSTRIIYPLAGAVKAGSFKTFSISSRDFSRFAIIIGEEFHWFKKNPSGTFTLELEIPGDIDKVVISAFKSGNSPSALVWYDVLK